MLFMKYILTHRKKSTLQSSNERFVTWMRKNDLQGFDTDKEFMEAYSHRKSTFEGITLRSDSVDHFVEDLEKNDLLRIEKEQRWKLF